MHKLAAAALALPVLILIYAHSLARRSGRPRVVTGLGVCGLVVFGLIAIAGSAPTTATPPSVSVPLTSAAFKTAVTTGMALDAPVTIEFSTPMERASVEASIAIDPPAPFELDWDAGGRIVTVSPRAAWAPDTYHRITLEAGALARTGRPLARSVASIFLTRGTTSGTIEAVEPAGRRVRVTTSFAISFARPVDLDSAIGALRIEPPIAGTFEATGGLAAGTHFTFTPSEALRPNTTYRLSLAGATTPDGERLDPLVLEARTAKAPAVVRFRPRDATKKIPRDAAISVRFSERMNRSSTKRSFRVEVDGKPVKGTIRFAEKDTVLVFVPAKKLPYKAKVVMTVDSTARSAVGTPLAKKTVGTFTTMKRPPKRTASTRRISPPSGGGGAASGNWGAVEVYYLRLMNCTRTGGWVTSSGSCRSPGGRNVAPLKLSAGISNKVARPYAKILATRGACTHFIGGNPGDRLRRAGYTSYRWAENIGCRSGAPKSAVLGTHLFFQSEKSYNGGHWVNMMSTKYDRVGIGVWVSSGRVRLVVDFYRP